MSILKEGDEVTVDFGTNNQASNTFKIYRKLEDESILIHPLCPDVLLIRSDDKLNRVAPKLKGSIERCLEFVKKHDRYLKYYDVCELQALCVYFTVYRSLTLDQLQRLSGLYEKVARILCNNSLNSAFKVLIENKAILLDDEFNSKFYRSHEKFILGKETEMTQRNIACLYRMAGFAMAQCERIVHEKP